MNRYLATCAVLALAACAPKTPAPAKTEAAASAPAAAPVSAADVDAGLTVPANTAPAGTYKLDPSHTNVSLRVSHLGFSHYTANFDKVAGTLQFDPAKPEDHRPRRDHRSEVAAPERSPRRLPRAGDGKEFLDAAAYPVIAFKSTKVEVTGPKTANVTGDLTLHGVTRPVTLATTFNGGYAANAFDGARIGFSANGVLKRSDFGIRSGLPAAGTNFGVGDNVVFAIETEFGSGGPVKATPPG